MTEHTSDVQHSLSEASKAARLELEKQGTPEYDARAHQRAVEQERKAADALDAAQKSTGA